MQLMGNRFLSLTTVIRRNQIEVTRDQFIGFDESDKISLQNARNFREAIRRVFPHGSITWALSYGALTAELDNFREVLDYARQCHMDYGDDVTYIAGGYFANAYNTAEGVDAEIDDALSLIERLMGEGYKPKCLIAGFLSSKNQRHLAEKHGIHACQGTIWSQFSIDNQDGDGSVCYPYYPSTQHFCKLAQGAEDQVDCVCLDGWTCDFVTARLDGCNREYNSRMGVGPIETIMTYGRDMGIAQQLETVAAHFDQGFQMNGFAFVPNIWELSLLELYDRECVALEAWLRRIVERWPDAIACSKGDFGLAWRALHRDNQGLDYRFVMQGTGLAGSKRYLTVKWYMNQSFRLGLIKDARDGSVKVMDFTSYEEQAREPESGSTRSWSLLGQINQKGSRPQDRPVPVAMLTDQQKAQIARQGIALAELEQF